MVSVEKALDYHFNNPALLENALTHSSFANENRGHSCDSNERLEFLGDSVLGMAVATELFRRFPDMPEGKMTRLRAQLVCEESLHRVAVSLGLGEYIRLGRGEERTGGRTRTSILADAVEALIAAMYIDGGYATAKGFIDRHILSQLEDGGAVSTGVDSKTRLQELVQKKNGQQLVYNMLSESGPDHNKIFTAEVCLNGSRVGEGRGHTKKEAEQAAAASALELLTK